MQTIFSRGLLLFFTLCVSTVLLGCHDWIQKTPASKPSARSSHAMAAVGGDKVLLFGGQDNVGPNAETWVYDLSANTWTDKSTRMTPSARTGHAMAYIGSDRALLFGGFDGADSDETWVYDFSLGTWTQKGLSGDKPPARRLHAMAYLGGDKVLLFGGFSSSAFDDTWVYDLSEDKWSEKLPGSVIPSARALHSMAYSGDDTVVLFGGLVNNDANRETWVYDLSVNKWAQKAMSGDRPSARRNHAMAYEGSDNVVLFGGVLSDGSTRSGETWTYDRSNDLWTQDLSQESQPQPAPRSDHALAHFSAPGTLGVRTVVLFGGNETAEVSDETWVYSPGAGNEPPR